MKKYNKIKFWGIILFLATGLFFLSKNIFQSQEVETADNNSKSESRVTQLESAEKSADNPWSKVEKYTVAEGDIPADVFASQGNLNNGDTLTLLAAAKDVYDFSRIKIGQELRFYFLPEEEKAKRIEYDHNTETQIIAEREGDGFSVREEKINYAVEIKTVEATIDEFLYKDALDAGISEATILEIADIFSFDIDFTTDIRASDSFKVIYEKRTLNGQPASDGRVLAAKFINAGEEYRSYYFTDGEEGSHYDGEGHELQRQFLRAPLSYRRITSGYTGARYHPITKTVSAHYQIDYGAPAGTPVVATARGTVVSAGWEGGWGNIIRLKHDNGYTTHYGHLSAFAKGVKSGASVSQGQVVGYVGSTGWSTGPHLDYGMRLNGAPINPLSLKLPKGIPLTGEKMEAFQKIKEDYDRELN